MNTVVGKGSWGTVFFPFSQFLHQNHSPKPQLPNSILALDPSLLTVGQNYTVFQEQGLILQPHSFSLLFSVITLKPRNRDHFPGW